LRSTQAASRSRWEAACIIPPHSHTHTLRTVTCVPPAFFTDPWVRTDTPSLLHSRARMVFLTWPWCARDGVTSFANPPPPLQDPAALEVTKQALLSAGLLAQAVSAYEAACNAQAVRRCVARMWIVLYTSMF
jgi:hypothetical protein